jgi:hypothetical protein
MPYSSSTASTNNSLLAASHNACLITWQWLQLIVRIHSILRAAFGSQPLLLNDEFGITRLRLLEPVIWVFSSLEVMRVCYAFGVFLLKVRNVLSRYGDGCRLTT